MKVLINTPDIKRNGGVANFYRMLLPKMSDDEELFIIGGEGGKNNVFSKLIETVRNYFSFCKRLHKGKCKIVHLNPSLGKTALFRDGIYVLLAKLYGCKVLLFFHGWNLKCEAWLERWPLILFKKTFFKADKILVLAQGFKDKLLEWGYRGDIETITTCVSEEFVREAKENKRKSISNKLLFLARIEKDKGIYETVNAFKLIRQKFPECSLYIAGDGSELENLKKYVVEEKIPDVVFLGYVRGDDKLKIFCEAGCYIYPSYSEGMPIALLEAMVSGLPVITSKVGGVPDFFTDDMGYMIEGTDYLKYAEAAEKILSDPEAALRIGQYNQNFALEKFTPSSVLDKLRKIYSSLS